MRVWITNCQNNYVLPGRCWLDRYGARRTLLCNMTVLRTELRGMGLHVSRIYSATSILCSFQLLNQNFKLGHRFCLSLNHIPSARCTPGLRRSRATHVMVPSPWDEHWEEKRAMRELPAEQPRLPADVATFYNEEAGVAFPGSSYDTVDAGAKVMA